MYVALQCLSCEWTHTLLSLLTSDGVDSSSITVWSEHMSPSSHAA